MNPTIELGRTYMQIKEEAQSQHMRDSHSERRIRMN
jgi:hypothetical protein